MLLRSVIWPPVAARTSKSKGPTWIAFANWSNERVFDERICDPETRTSWKCKALALSPMNTIRSPALSSTSSATRRSIDASVGIWLIPCTQ